MVAIAYPWHSVVRVIGTKTSHIPIVSDLADLILLEGEGILSMPTDANQKAVEKVLGWKGKSNLLSLGKFEIESPSYVEPQRMCQLVMG